MHHLRCHSWSYIYSICNVNSASFRAIQSFRNIHFPPFHVPLRQCQMTVMTSGIASQSSVQEFVETDQNKYQRSALLSLCGRNPPETAGCPTKRDSNTANFSVIMYKWHRSIHRETRSNVVPIPTENKRSCFHTRVDVAFLITPGVIAISISMPL